MGNKGKHITITVMKCVKCGREHKIDDNYMICNECNSKQFHIITRKKDAGVTSFLFVILVILSIIYLIIRIWKNIK